MSRLDSSRRPRRRFALPFAGIVSAGMVATVVALAALLAPVLAWNGSPAPNARDRGQTIRLSKPTATPAAPSANRAARQLTVAAAGRLVATGSLRPAGERRAGAVPPKLAGRVGVTDRAPRSTVPLRTGPLATSSHDTDGDGLPDAWELRYGLDPENAADATADPDGDGLDNRTERRIRTAPNGADSDRNGVRDGDEDSDGDGAPNLSELLAGTDPDSSEDAPPAAEPKDPVPAVVPDDTGVADDTAPPEPGPPDDGQPDPEVTPVPAPDIPVPADPVPDVPAPEDPAPADPGGETPSPPPPPADDTGTTGTTPPADTNPLPATTPAPTVTPAPPPNAGDSGSDVGGQGTPLAG